MDDHMAGEVFLADERLLAFDAFERLGAQMDEFRVLVESSPAVEFLAAQLADERLGRS